MDKSINFNPNLIKYIFANTDKLHKVQKDLIEYNKSLGHIKKLQISVLQSNFLQFLVKLTKAQNCLEIGTFTGFSALSMALSLPKNGKVLTIDKNHNTTDTAKSFFKKAGVEKKIITIVDIALNRLKLLIKDKKNYDLILIDADKENYKKYFKYSLKLITRSGLIVVDNILWKGDVSDLAKNSKILKKIRNFNKYIKKLDVNKYILPVGDGFTICWKKND